MGRFRADAIQYIEASIDADSDYCLPRIVNACMLQGANNARFDTEVATLIEQSRRCLPADEGIEADLLQAVSAANARHGREAATIYEQLLMVSPDDLFLHVLAQ